MLLDSVAFLAPYAALFSWPLQAMVEQVRDVSSQ